jgi:hypothetical protein
VKEIVRLAEYFGQSIRPAESAYDLRLINQHGKANGPF